MGPTTTITPLAACRLLVLFSLFIIGLGNCASAGPGFAFSGAGGRIGQHIALAEALIEGYYPGAKPIRPSVLSGASSGAITAVLVNAVLESKETGRINWTWDRAKSVLFNITTSDIIDDSALGILKISENMLFGYFLDNTPMVSFLKNQLSQIGYKKLGDLYVPTCISLVNQSSGYSHRFCSDDTRWQNLDLLELVVGSASLPMAFIPRIIDGLGDTVWIDGGTGIDTLPVYSLIDKEEVSSIYIICYASALTSGGADSPSWLGDIPLLKNSLATIDDMRVDLFLAGLGIVAAQKLKPSFSYIPHLNQTFSVLDFDQEKLEYTLTAAWASTNDPLRLN